MAVDFKGQPLTNLSIFSTTGLVNRKPAEIESTKIPQIKKPEPKVVQKNLPEERLPQINLENLRDDDKRILNIHLTPSLKNVFNRIFGQDIFPEFGINENTVSIPRSIIIDRFGSLQDFKKVIQRDETNQVPPSQGLMTSPQTQKV